MAAGDLDRAEALARAPLSADTREADRALWSARRDIVRIARGEGAS